MRNVADEVSHWFTASCVCRTGSSRPSGGSLNEGPLSPFLIYVHNRSKSTQLQKRKRRSVMQASKQGS
ncbi:Protein of unknown function [Gryllus bimaculatus]|nr:Protein of unknown function [Gryllus bimaculatus]